MSTAIRRVPLWWRHLLLGGVAAGLIAAGLGVTAPSGWPLIVAVALGALAATSLGAPEGPGAALARSVALVAVGTLLGTGAGGERMAAIAGDAYRGAPGDRIVAEGIVAGQPRLSVGELRFLLETRDGRLLVSSSEHPDLGIGDRVSIRGGLREAEPFRSAELARNGAALELRAREIDPLPGGRAGLPGALDRARDRAEGGLAAGLGEQDAALARGFVLGQDDRIDPETREHFRRSGLAHLLAVSGQNVMLLAILAGVLLSLAGVGARTRLLLLLVLIAAYVPIAGGAASIQRAGIMGGAGILAGLAGRPADRLYVLLLAAVATLLLNPHSAAEVGWQLSFAAVVGIALWAAPLRGLLLDRVSALPERLAAGLAEGAALTIAATLATAPLMAHHFEAVSLASLPANLLVLPAVAPVMWLGMAAALLAQLPAVPTAPIAFLEGPLLAYIATVAELLARPDWSLLRLPAPAPALTAGAYAALLAALYAGLAALRRRSGLRVPGKLGILAALGAALVLLPAAAGSGSRSAPDPRALRITQLDVGQGDALLLQQAGRSLLVDTGPPGARLADLLRERDIRSLEAVVITHDQSDHSGGLGDLTGRVPYRRLLLARPSPGLAALARQAGAGVERVAEGSSLALGPVAITALWPPAGETTARSPVEDPNDSSLVLAVEHRGFRALLTADAELEATRLDPGPLDVLKVAHHGSADAGLEGLLDRSAPRVALIGVGAGNPHGHPTPETLASLEQRQVCTLRTDLDGAAWVELGPAGLRAGSERATERFRPGCGVQG